jgi:hypothetical protein
MAIEETAMPCADCDDRGYFIDPDDHYVRRCITCKRFTSDNAAADYLWALDNMNGRWFDGQGES